MMIIAGTIQAVLFAFVIWESGNSAYMRPFPHGSMEACQEMIEAMKTDGLRNGELYSKFPDDGLPVEWNAVCLPVDEDSLLSAYPQTELK